jgi:hypothetical protein
MSDASRRGFLVLAGAGTAAVATAGAVALAQSSDEPKAVEGHNATGAMVAWIGDVKKSEITIMLGEREVVVQDADLVTKLVRASGQV